MIINWGINMHFDEEPSHECYLCDDTYKKLDTAKYWLESIVEQLYSTEPIDTLKFEDHLEELCYQLEMHIPKTSLHIKRLP